MNCYDTHYHDYNMYNSDKKINIIFIDVLELNKN